MLIKNLDLKEFRGIKGFEKPLEFSKFTVLIGRNNSGKSTILQALYLLPDPFSESAIPPSKRIEYLRKIFENPVYIYSGTAKIKYNNEKITMDINDSFGIDSFKVSGKEIKKVEGWNTTKIYEYFKTKSPEEFSVLISSDTKVLKDINSKITELQNKIVKSGAHIRVAKAISECVSDNYTEILPDTLKIRKEPLDGAPPHYIRIEDLGDGAKKAVKLMLLLEVIKPKLVLWDDFEASAHPSLIKILLSWLSQKEWQVVLSTHSIDVLYELLEANPRDLRILQLSKDKDDILHYKTLTPEELEDFMDANLDPRLLTDLLNL
jgi:AAA15 family ATPase/GTPase